MSEYVQPYQDNMNKSIDHLRNDLAAIRAGRANPAVLDKITVDYYGVPTKINQMAAISVAEARILVITPWDASTIRNIQRAILASDIGINPTDDGRSLRLVFPQLTEERRRELVKDIKNVGIPLTNDRVYGGMSNRRNPISIFKWVYVSPPTLIKEADTSNIHGEDAVGLYTVELGVYKRAAR